MYGNLLVLRIIKTNIGLDTSFWLILIIYTGEIITQTKEGYWNYIKELNFPYKSQKSIMTKFYKNELKAEILI